MKYISLIGIAVLLVVGVLFSAHAPKQERSKSANVRIQVEGYQAGKVYLVGIYKNVKSNVDSTFMDTEGQFVFQQPENYAAGQYIVALPDSSNFNILLDIDQDFSLTTESKDLIGSMVVEGSLDNELLYKDLQLQLAQEADWQTLVAQEKNQEILLQQRDEIVKARKAALQQSFKKYPNTLFTKLTRAQQDMLFFMEDYTGPGGVDQMHFVRSHFWDAIDFSDQRLLHTEVIFDKLYAYMNQWTLPQTDSIRQSVDFLMEKVLDRPEYYQFFAEWITDSFRPMHSALNDPEALYVYMVDRYLNYESAPSMDSIEVYAWQLRAKERGHGLMGNIAADLIGKDPQNKSRALMDVDAPYVALYIYSPECSHCIEETPAFVSFYEEHKSKGFEVYAVGMWSEEDVWKEFIKENEMDWINVIATEEMDINSKYYIEGVPDIYLLNPDRKIIGKHLNVEEILPLIQADVQGTTLVLTK